MKIVILEPLSIRPSQLQRYVDELQQLGHSVVHYPDRPNDTPTILSRVQDADVVVLTNLPFPKEVISQCASLKMISVAFTGVDHIDLDACKERNVVVCNAAGYSTYSVVELTFGLIFSLLRNILLCDHNIRMGRTRCGLIGNELHGKTLGVIGTGAIGSQVCQIATAFGCKVIAYSRTEKADLQQLGVQYVALNEMLQKSDIVSLHLPLNSETKGLLDLHSFQMMKKTALLINCARGPIVNTKDLLRALDLKLIAGAGLDVFDQEPPLDSSSPLFQAENLVVTPHVAFATHEAFENRAQIVFENILQWLNDTPINQV
ncbi:Glyoxylate reductase [Candidatus Lokiarchaeum ossiferum]|uniref:Glyoxylate reductase n=1 Tax=Candidatus Lokiarchaeum ossiferum TaxID=2951803 RepID=A0ABY6HK88_9ARCH|nr:Glyoxylate reductase [Candidatus Lokiarchaeum sp. B-35]